MPKKSSNCIFPLTEQYSKDTKPLANITNIQNQNQNIMETCLAPVESITSEFTMMMMMFIFL